MMHQRTKMPHQGKLLVSAAVVVATVGLAMLAMLLVADDSEPTAVSASVAGPTVPLEKGTKMTPVNKSEAEWKAQLTPEQYHVTREKGTERAFTGQYWNHKEDGVYKCICCGAELFKSDTKYDSHCGWPSFYASDSPQNLHEEVDRTHGMIRTEVTCSKCGAHLGHVFDDGPQPTGVRYCMNSASLQFEKQPEGEQPSEPLKEEK